MLIPFQILIQKITNLRFRPQEITLFYHLRIAQVWRINSFWQCSLNHYFVTQKLIQPAAGYLLIHYLSDLGTCHLLANALLGCRQVHTVPPSNVKLIEM